MAEATMPTTLDSLLVFSPIPERFVRGSMERQLRWDEYCRGHKMVGEELEGYKKVLTFARNAILPTYITMGALLYYAFRP